MCAKKIESLAVCWLVLVLIGSTTARSEILFNTNFEGGSLGKIEVLAPCRFRCSVQGQYDERGRNRQANWYFFRMDGVAGLDLTLTLSDVVGEYDDKPGACPMNGDTIPVFSDDGEHWQHFKAMTWDDSRKEATLIFQPTSDRIWIAHVPPYTHSRLLQKLDQIGKRPSARLEVIGKTVHGRDLHLVTVTNFERADQGKRHGLAASSTTRLGSRNFLCHGGRTGVHHVRGCPGRRLRDKVVFVFTPMLDPDGCATGKVRFNANGYDVNRHWDDVDLRSKSQLERMPEIWYVKKAILGLGNAGRSIDLFLNLHNTEMTEYLETQARDPVSRKRISRLSDLLVTRTSFDPAGPLRFTDRPDHSANALYHHGRVPVVLMEQRIGTSKKLGRRLTVADRLEFGKELITAMARAALQSER